MMSKRRVLERGDVNRGRSERRGTTSSGTERATGDVGRRSVTFVASVLCPAFNRECVVTFSLLVFGRGSSPIFAIFSN